MSSIASKLRINKFYHKVKPLPVVSNPAFGITTISLLTNDFLSQMNIESFAIYLAPLALIVFFYLRGRYKHETSAVEVLTESIEAGLTEPSSLHPEINPNLCMGRQLHHSLPGGCNRYDQR